TNATANAAIVMFASSSGTSLGTPQKQTGLFTTATSPVALCELYGDIADSNGNAGAGWGIKTTANSTTGTGSATRNPSGNNDNAWAAILLALKPGGCSCHPTIGGQGSNTTIECPATPNFTAPTTSDTCGGNPTVSQV